MPPSAQVDLNQKSPLVQVLERNIHAIRRTQSRIDLEHGTRNRIAYVVACCVGSLWAIGFHVVFIGGWVVVNLGLIPGITPFDPFPFGSLTAITSIEAIFLSMFVLINQMRMTSIGESRDDLALQMCLLTEHEITRLIRVTDLIARKLQIETVATANDLEDIKTDIRPDFILDRIREIDEMLETSTESKST